MQFSEVSVTAHPGTLTSDRCARSGLHTPVMKAGAQDPVSFSTVYTINFAKMSEFYRKLLGNESVRIDGDGLLVFGHSCGSVVIKRIGGESQFAKLVGRQSLGLVGMAPTEFANTSVGKDLGWDTNVTQINDPDGNVILFAEPEATEVVQNVAMNG